ncbi:hypothetical protein [Arthrobacter sp. Y-9]|uniref:hypothetical protein n=1 Tax=Arthrobacter sp. Y-9 TaxID=3039385 RepID=UPI00241FB6DA|nr:hypothetical protein [Arthrobacter sp. Y-9]WFR84656.1 hypothetical protein P9849_03175 [Arthrobacter sp. Y-9]
MSYDRIPARIQLTTPEEIREALQIPDSTPVAGVGRAWIMGAEESWELFLTFERATELVTYYQLTGLAPEFRIADDGQTAKYRILDGPPVNWREHDDAEAWVLPWDEAE